MKSGEQQFCPSILKRSPLIEMTDHRRGAYFSHSLNIQYLPGFLVNVLGLAALGFFPLIASYYLWTNDPDKRPALRTIFLAALALCLCVAVLRLTGWPLTIEGVLALIRRLFTSVSWQFVGAALALVLYLSIALEAVWQGMRHRRVADFCCGRGIPFVYCSALSALWIRHDRALGRVVWSRLLRGLGAFQDEYGTVITLLAVVATCRRVSDRFRILRQLQRTLCAFPLGKACSVLRHPALSRCSEIVCFLDYNAIRCLSGRRRLNESAVNCAAI